MNLFRRMLALFGRQYVFLEWYDGEIDVRHAYAVGKKAYANPGMPKTRAELLPGGKIGKGPSYVRAWHPITRGTFELYDRVQRAA